jgi:outer membrane protein assembly factor BamB
VAGGDVYVGSLDGNLYALDPETREERWGKSLDGEVYASPAVVDDAIELPDGRVAITIMWNLGDDAADGDKLSTFVIFIVQDGHWLIDERY